MAVNTMGIEDAYALIAELHLQATGRKVLTPVSLVDFISVAQATLQNGYEPVLNAISQMVGRTLVAVRPYGRKFAGLEVSAERWGGIIRKLSFADRDPISNPSFTLTDGTSVDQFEIRKPVVLETRYVGSDLWLGQYTITTKQLELAFSGPQELANFMSGLMTHFSNEREQWLEEMARASVANFMGALNILGTGHVIHLLTEYNTATGLSLTSTTVRQPANFPAFARWCYARIEMLSKMMSERSQLFQQVITGYSIMRHTPVEDQRIFLDADLMAHMDAEVLADTYHDNYLRRANTESVTYWQNISSPNEISVTPVYIDNTGTIVSNAANQAVDDIVGVMFDRDAIGYNIYQDTLERSPYDRKGQYYNLFHHTRIMYQNDVSEKGILLLLD